MLEGGGHSDVGCVGMSETLSLKVLDTLMPWSLLVLEIVTDNLRLKGKCLEAGRKIMQMTVFVLFIIMFPISEAGLFAWNYKLHVSYCIVLGMSSFPKDSLHGSSFLDMFRGIIRVLG